MTALVVSMLCSALAAMLLVVEHLFPLPDRHTQMAVVTLTTALLFVCLWASVTAAEHLSLEMQRLRDVEATLHAELSRRKRGRL